MKSFHTCILILVLANVVAFLLPTVFQAQVQDYNFSANDTSCNSYQCLDASGKVGSEKPDWEEDIDGRGKCMCSTGPAVLKPPKLQQLQIWFSRILYVVWALVAGFSFLMLVYLGYRFMLRGGTTDEELVKLRRDILNYAIGFAIVFLAVPILNTFFRILQINDNVRCYDVNMPGFQFFFNDLCTDPKRLATASIVFTTALACPVVNDQYEGVLCNLEDREKTYGCYDQGADQLKVYTCPAPDYTWQYEQMDAEEMRELIDRAIETLGL